MTKATKAELGNPSYGGFDSGKTFGLGYELVISEPVLFEQSWDRFCSTRLGSIMHLVDEEQDFHAGGYHVPDVFLLFK